MTTSPPAAPVPPGVDQDGLDSAYRVLDRWLSGHPRSGYIGARTDVAAREIRVWWHGTVPARLRAELAATPAGVAVRFTGSPVDPDELRDGLARVQAAMSPTTGTGRHLAADGIGLASVSARVDGSAIDVGVAQRSGRAATAGQTATARRLLRSLTSIPLAVTGQPFAQAAGG